VLSTYIDSVKSFLKWLVIVGSCVSIMNSFVYQRPAVSYIFRLMYTVQRLDNNVIAATTVRETVL